MQTQFTLHVVSRSTDPIRTLRHGLKALARCGLRVVEARETSNQTLASSEAGYPE